MNMFCYQCQETAKNTSCTIKGLCGKEALTSNLQDLLVFSSKSLAQVGMALENQGQEIPEDLGHTLCHNLFMTITNANFNDQVILDQVKRTLELKENYKSNLESTKGLTEIGLYIHTTDEDLRLKALDVGVLRTDDKDIRSLRELILYGLKGLAAYVKHANVLGKEDKSLHSFICHALTCLDDDSLTLADLVDLSLETGSKGVQAMALLDEANTSSYGNPEITEVNLGVRNNPGILISGHDLRDLKMLLDQTQGTGIDVYTHSEMLAGHYYPDLKKYANFVGNYGGSWHNQAKDFASFNGPILMTTNCITPVKDEYKDRFYTTGSASYPGTKHIPGEIGQVKDFSEIINHAKTCQAPVEIERGSILGGFAHNQVFELAGPVVEAIKKGDISKFVVMAGCDGRQAGRNYYTDFAKALPSSAVILTAGCAKYRYNKLKLGDIKGIPRVLDAGQCNDSYSLVMVALKLKEIFSLDDINDLPIAYNIAWYEQKAVIVLLALLSLGVKNIHLGPSLPAFLSENVTKVLVDSFGLTPIKSVEEDIKNFFPDLAL